MAITEGGLFKFYRNTVITLELGEYIFKRISLNNITTTTFRSNDRNRLLDWHDICRFTFFNFADYDSCECMDVAKDYSKIAILDFHNQLLLYDLRKFNPLNPSSLGEPPLFSACVYDRDHHNILFNPDGSKLAFTSHELISVLCVNNYHIEASRECIDMYACHFCWYDNENVCFFERDTVVTWNVVTDEIRDLFPAIGRRLYAHPKLPLIADYNPRNEAEQVMFRLWSA